MVWRLGWRWRSSGWSSMRRRCAGRQRDLVTPMRRVASWLWRWCWTGMIGARQRRFAAWAARRCETGINACVDRYNDLGLVGLSSRIPTGPRPRLTPEQEAEVAAMVRAGPSLAEHGVVRWRRADLSRVRETRFGVHLAERSVGDMLRRPGFRRLTARPRHIGHDADAQEAHKKLCRPGRRCDPPSMRGPSRSSSVAGRSQSRPARHPDPALGRARLATSSTTRRPLGVGLPFWRRLSGARHRRCSGAALRRHQRDEPAPRRDQQACRAWRTRHDHHRRRRLAPARRYAEGA